jgi:hypothetical protein
MSADGVGTNEIMHRTSKSKTCVWRWQERFIKAGYDGLLRDRRDPSVRDGAISAPAGPTGAWAAPGPGAALGMRHAWEVRWVFLCRTG